MKRSLSLKSATGVDLELSYFVEWRRRIWTPAVTYLIEDPTRFAGKSVLDLGCRDGRMSCLFGLLGATVLGVELTGVPITKAWEEAGRWNLDDRVSFAHYDGNALSIPGEHYDYVFTKSVLVVVSELENFLSGLATKLKPNGELMAAENLTGGYFVSLYRRCLTYRRDPGMESLFHGVDACFLSKLNSAFNVTGLRTFYGTVAAIRARRK